MIGVLDLLRKVKRKLNPIPPLSKIPVGTSNLSTREAWLKQSLANIPAGHRILDAGAGELKYKPLCAHLEYVSQDFGQYDGKGNSAGLQVGKWDNTKLDLVSDITSIPAADSSFDAVMCIEVLEHVPAPVDALRELARLLKPGGVLIVTAPFCSLTHFAPYFFQTGYSRYFYEHWLSALGFEIEDMQFNGNYFEYMAQELRRLPSMSQRYAQLPLKRHDMNAINRLLETLNRLSDQGEASDEFLCFGIHVRARKRAAG